MIILTIHHSDWIIIYTFNEFDLYTTLADFGGYINACFIVLNFVGTLINNYLFTKHILKNLNSVVSYDTLLHNKTKKGSKKNKDKKNINNEEIINETQNLYFPKKENINLDNSVKTFSSK